MKPKNKKFYVTTSIPYANAAPHIGFALEAVQADVLARYHRLLGEDTFFLTGTDEHGIKNKEAAQKAGKEPEEFVSEISNKFKKLTKKINLSNNDFIRTTDQKRHWPAVKKVWNALKQNGDLYKKKYKGYYCVGCEAFVKKSDLVKGKCPVHQKKPEIIEEENYFFRLSKYEQQIKEAIKKNKLKIIPETRKRETLKFIKDGLADVSFSRKKERYWGFSVPGDGSQTAYVWPDALTNYISALGYAEGSDKFKKYWPANVHCIGKDIMRFHALIWPGMLFSLGVELPESILVHGFITSAGKKMSKSIGNVVDPFELIDRYGADSVRYYLLREIPSTKDGDFTYQKFEKRYNADLAKGLGNLLSRVRTMAEKTGFKETDNNPLSSKIKEAVKNHKKTLDNFEFNRSLMAVWGLIGSCDRYIEKEKPWESSRGKNEKSKQVLGNLLVVLDNIAEMLVPFMPETSIKIKEEIKRDKTKGKFIKKEKGKPLFPKV